MTDNLERKLDDHCRYGWHVRRFSRVMLEELSQIFHGGLIDYHCREIG